MAAMLAAKGQADAAALAVLGRATPKQAPGGGKGGSDAAAAQAAAQAAAAACVATQSAASSHFRPSAASDMSLQHQFHQHSNSFKIN